MKTMIEVNGREPVMLCRTDLGREVYWLLSRGLKVGEDFRVIAVPETDDEVRDQKEKAAKAAEERRSHAAHIHRPSKTVKEAFFYGRQVEVPAIQVIDGKLSLEGG